MKPAPHPARPAPPSQTIELPTVGERRGLRRRFVGAVSALVALVLLAQGALLFYFELLRLRGELEPSAALDALGWQILGLGLAVFALGVACTWLLSAQSLVPVERLIDGARRLARGELDHRIHLRTGDEFEVLGATLDHMAGRLADTVSRLETSNERLERLNHELRELDLATRDFLANVSHELRTPLTAISGHVEAMAAGFVGDLDADQQRSIAVMERNVLRLRAMIDDLLSYSRLESGRLELAPGPFALEPVARDVVAAIEAAHGGEALDLRFDCAPDLPEAYGDPIRIAQVMENLLTNAVKFSPPGGRIDLRIREVTGGVEVTVADRGIGIPEHLQHKIFDRFYQIDASTRRSAGGMGLGLAIVREILDASHSPIEVESRPGAGTTFRFLLPAVTANLSARRARRLAAAAGTD